MADLKHTAAEIDAAIYKVERGSVVTENTDRELTPDGNKPVSGGAIYTALQGKVDKVEGKGLSTNDYTTNDKTRVGNSVTGIRVNGKTKARKDSTGLLDIGDVSNLYVADFTIQDLNLLSSSQYETLNVNAKALMQALNNGRAIGVPYHEDDGNTPSMSIASAYKDDFIYLSVIDGDGIIYTTIIQCVFESDEEVADAESGLIFGSETRMLVVSDKAETHSTPFSVADINTIFDSGRSKEFYMRNLVEACEKNKIIIIPEGGGGDKGYSTASIYCSNTSISLSFVSNGTLYALNIDRTSQDYGIIQKNFMTVRAISDIPIKYCFDFDLISILDAHSNGDTITCDYVGIVNGIDQEYGVYIYAGDIGLIQASAFLEGSDIIVSVIAGDMWVKFVVEQFEDEDSNISGLIHPTSTFVTNLKEARKNTYIIRDFTLENIFDGDDVLITRELTKAIEDERPLAIYDTDGGRLIQISAVAHYDFSTTTNIYIEISYGIHAHKISFQRASIVTDGAPASVKPTVESRQIAFYDEIDGVKREKIVARDKTGAGDFVFGGEVANLANKENIIKNNILYCCNHSTPAILIKDISRLDNIEFKIFSNSKAVLTINGKYRWEKNSIPDKSTDAEVMYSFFILKGMLYISTKIYE